MNQSEIKPPRLNILSQEQELAIEKMADHCYIGKTGAGSYFVLEGPAGTGKTYSTRRFVDVYKGRALMTAPTNKAVRVLREALTDDDYRPECKTIYSALGLQMQANGEIKELAKPEEDVDLSHYKLIVVDEASMISTALLGHIAEAAAEHRNLHWIFMGDPYQLPPVGEPKSPVWSFDNGARLTTIMRQDNQILKLATHLRVMVDKPFGTLKLENDNDGVEGIWSTTGPVLEKLMLARADTFLKGESKAIAWRNVEVDRLNGVIRQELFAETSKHVWQPGDRITLLEPAKDQLSEEGKLIATTDEEGAVESVHLAEHPRQKGFECWRIQMRSDFNTSITLWVPTAASVLKINNRAARLAAEAKAGGGGRAWKEYWEFKESFHRARHAYAITAHRAQGSTYQRAFVSWRDILLNRSRGEAMRCLYVACTRPRKELYLG